MQCNLLPDSDDPDACVGHKEVKEARIRAQKPCKPVKLSFLRVENFFHFFAFPVLACSKDGFLCDGTRCIPSDWKCDGHLDCEDKTDEQDCDTCPPGMVHCGEKKCMDNSHKCDGIIDCPYGQDERNCSEYTPTKNNFPLVKFLKICMITRCSKTSRKNGGRRKRLARSFQSRNGAVVPCLRFQLGQQKLGPSHLRTNGLHVRF